MKQIIEVKGFHVPWHLNDQKRPIFSTKAKRDEFLDAYATGYEKAYIGLDFNPEQETLVLSPQAFTVEAVKAIKKINYVRVRTYLGTATPEGLLDEFFYFVTSNTLPPVYDLDGSGENTGTITAGIKLDVWLTYVYPANYTYINTGSVIEQSTPLTPKIDGVFDDANPRACENLLSSSYPFRSSQSFNGREVFYRKVDEGVSNINTGTFGSINIGTERTWENAFYFVGVFGSDTFGTIVCARPLDLYELTNVDAYANLSTLLTINKLKLCQITRNGFFEVTGGAVTSYDINVNLLRAYIIPKKTLQRTSIDNATEGLGYRIVSTSKLGEYPHKTALVNVEQDAIKRFESYIAWDAQRIFEGGEWNTTGHPIYADIGTPTTRLEILKPSQTGNSKVTFISQVSPAGFSLIMSVDGRQVDIGGDFEIPVPDNAEAEAFARNKWSLALQGVSHVGGIAASVITKNPVAIAGSLLSTGQFVANIGEQQSVPSTIQGQGNGNLTYQTAGLQAKTGIDTRGAVYVRYALPTGEEVKQAERFGYKWLGAFVKNTITASKALFSNGLEKYGRTFVKMGACSISFSNSSNDPENQGSDIINVPQNSVDEIERILNAGAFIYFNPDATDPDWTQGVGG